MQERQEMLIVVIIFITILSTESTPFPKTNTSETTIAPESSTQFDDTSALSTGDKIGIIFGSVTALGVIVTIIACCCLEEVKQVKEACCRICRPCCYETSPSPSDNSNPRPSSKHTGTDDLDGPEVTPFIEPVDTVPNPDNFRERPLSQPVDVPDGAPVSEEMSGIESTPPASNQEPSEEMPGIQSTPAASNQGTPPPETEEHEDGTTASAEKQAVGLQTKKDDVLKPSHIKAFLQELTPHQLNKVYEELDIPFTEVQKAIARANTNDPDDKAKEVLRDWQMENGKNATPRALLQALKECKYNLARQNLEEKWGIRLH